MSVDLDASSIKDGYTVKEPIKSLCLAIPRRGSIKLLPKEFSEGFTGTRVFLAEEHAIPDDRRGQRLAYA